MGEIKSALEIALERAEKIGKASKEDLERSRWEEEGRKIAVKFMNQELDLKEAVAAFAPEAIPHLIRAMTEVFARNIFLPREKDHWQSIEKALKGLQELKGTAILQVIENIRYLLQSYEQTRQQYLQQMKVRFQGQLNGLKQALAQQYGMNTAENVDVESLPEFQQEWMKISSEIDSQYDQQLQQLKSYLIEG